MRKEKRRIRVFTAGLLVMLYSICAPVHVLAYSFGQDVNQGYPVHTLMAQLSKKAPPNLPSRPYIYAEFTREVVLGWDEPADYSNNLARYNLYQKKPDGTYTLVKNGGGIDPKKKYFIVYGLEPETTYTFVFEAEANDGTKSDKSRELIVTTRAENTLLIEEQPKNQRTDESDPTASFTAKLNVENTAGETVCQWQTVDARGQWIDIPGAVDTLTGARRETSYTTNNAKDRSFYRVKATRYYQNKSLPSVRFSKGASVLYSNVVPDVSFDIVDEAEDLIFPYTFVANTDGADALYSGTAVIAEPGAGSLPTRFSLPVKISTSLSTLNNNYVWKLNLLPDKTDFATKEKTFSVSHDSAKQEYAIRVEVFLVDNQVSESDTRTVKVLVPGQDKHVYTIAYDLSQGSNIPENPEQIGREAQSSLTLAAPSRKGSAFLGFRFKGSNAILPFQDPDGQVTVVDMQALGRAADAQGRVTFEAVWQDEIYPITYEDTQGAANLNPSGYTLYSEVPLQGLAREGYRFTGWYSDAGHTNRVQTLPADLPPQDQGQDITLYAGWEADRYVVGGEEDDPRDTVAEAATPGDENTREEAPNTGDTSRLWLLALAASGSAAGILTIAVTRRKSRTRGHFNKLWRK